MPARSASSDDPDRYLTVRDGPEIETRVKGSRFLAQAFFAADETAVSRRLHAIGKRYHDATHHCWACRQGVPGEVRERFDDDGEPAGTAGQPILGALLRADVYDALLVVTRYFGGTKLGTGGLARAYGAAAREAMREAARVPRWREATLAVACDFDDLGTVETVLARHAPAVRSVERAFTPRPTLAVTVRKSHAADLRAALIEATGGRAQAEPADPEVP